jgi:hypothetical protein
MPEYDPAVRIAGDLLMARLVDHDNLAMQELLDQVSDVQQSRYIITALLIMIDNILERNDTLRRQAIDRLRADRPRAEPSPDKC